MENGGLNMKKLILIAVLLFASCTSNDVTKNNQSVDNPTKINEQNVEYDELQKENEKLKKEVSDLNEKIEEMKDLHEDK
jgi:peptidoglycan hydrolase CwlO-like protein